MAKLRFKIKFTVEVDEETEATIENHKKTLKNAIMLYGFDALDIDVENIIIEEIK